MSSILKCNVISYDYSGYGCSRGIANESEINDDIFHVISFCNTALQINLNKLILFGDSLGTTPTIHISSSDKYQELAGVVLVSPTSSGSYFSYLSELKNENKKKKYSTVHKESKINNISCPVFFIHGHKNSIIPVSQSIKLSDELKHSGKSYCWFPKQGTHDNILSELRPKFYKKFAYFLDLIERFQNQHKIHSKYHTDLNIRPTFHMGNISIGKPREENYISVNDGRATTNMVIPNPISASDNKMKDLSSFAGNDSSNFVVMNDTERITNVMMTSS